jgi:3,4-dehydroadipyl-CoA semialdehyde dehydrogenase
LQLQNLLADRWQAGAGPGQALIDPTLGTEIARGSSDGLDLAAAMDFARQQGGPALRELTYAARGALLGRIADVLAANRGAYMQVALENSGSPEADASIDIDGSIYTLKYYARLGAGLGDARYFQEGDSTGLSKDGAFGATHLLLPLQGVAVLVNAFNFPAWGLWEKAAPALLSGVPVFAKPATSTALLAYRMVQDVVAANVLPRGALSLVCGSARELAGHLDFNDVLAFTGSAETARGLRAHPAVLERGVRVNVEADSLNAALLGPDAGPDSEEFKLYVREVVREMTIKAGQKCTAIRRLLVPATHAGAVADAVAASLAKVVVGNPRDASVRMGPLVSASQRVSVEQGIVALAGIAERVTPAAPFQPVGADARIGAFVAPTLFWSRDPLAAASQAVHDLEVFGPVATLVPYDTEAEAYALAERGRGSLVASVFSADEDLLARAALHLGSSHGRVLGVNAAIGKAQTGHGNAMPQCLHGGPGRAGNGEELGGLRALGLYHRRCVIQGPAALGTRLGTAATRWNA